MVGFWLTIALLGLLPKVASGSSHGDLPGLYVLSQPCQSWFISSGHWGTNTPWDTRAEVRESS